MNAFEKDERRRLAQDRLLGQRRRANQLRVRVVVCSLAAFALLWGVVFAQMATGNDPVLAPKATAAKPETAVDSEEGSGAGLVAGSATATTDPEELEEDAAEPQAPEVEYVEPEPEPAPVVTSQS